MMREYGKTKSANWISPRLSGCARIIAAYLFGGPHTNWIGCFNCPPQYAAADTELPLAKVKKAYAELSAEGFIKPFRNMVCLVNFFATEKVDNPNVATSRFNEFMQLPDGQHKAFVAHEMLTYFGQRLTEEQKSHLVDLTDSEPLPVPLPEPLAYPSRYPSPNRDRDRDIYKSKAQQQLIRPGASAAPVTPPVDDSPVENVSAQPQPHSDAEPANGLQAIANQPAKASTAMAAEDARPADPVPEATTPPEPCPEQPHSADPVPESADLPSETETLPIAAVAAVHPEIYYAEVWGQLTQAQRHALAEQLGAQASELWAMTELWQFPEDAKQLLIQAMSDVRHNQLGQNDSTDPADTATDPGIDIGALWDGLSAQERYAVLKQAGAVNPEAGTGRLWSKLRQAVRQRLSPVLLALLEGTPSQDTDLVPENTDLPREAETESSPACSEAAPTAPLASENEIDKGIIHTNPNPAKIEPLQTVSEDTPAPSLTEAAFLRDSALPESVDIAVWHNFESMAREKVRWSAGTCQTLIRQLQQAMDNGADGNALLEWATVRSLLDLPDAWQRMQSDAAKKKAHEQQEDAAVLPTDDAPVTGTVSPTLAPEKPSKAKPSKNERGHRLPENWQPNDALMLWAQQRYPNVDAFLQIEKFCDYWHSKPGKEARKTDWDATFRNWIRKADEFAKSTGFKSPSTLIANAIPNASGRLYGESVKDAAMRVYLEDLKEQGISQDGSLKIGLFTPATPVLTHINGETPE